LGDGYKPSKRAKQDGGLMGLYIPRWVNVGDCDIWFAAGEFPTKGCIRGENEENLSAGTLTATMRSL